jgi:hypothetical protein
VCGLQCRPVSGIERIGVRSIVECRNLKILKQNKINNRAKIKFFLYKQKEIVNSVFFHTPKLK